MYPVIICVYFLPTFLNCIQITGEKEKTTIMANLEIICESKTVN